MYIRMGDIKKMVKIILKAKKQVFILRNINFNIWKTILKKKDLKSYDIRRLKTRTFCKRT